MKLKIFSLTCNDPILWRVDDNLILRVFVSIFQILQCGDVNFMTLKRKPFDYLCNNHVAVFINCVVLSFHLCLRREYKSDGNDCSE